MCPTIDHLLYIHDDDDDITPLQQTYHSYIDARPFITIEAAELRRRRASMVGVTPTCTCPAWQKPMNLRVCIWENGCDDQYTEQTEFSL